MEKLEPYQTLPTKTLYEELQVSAGVPIYVAINYKLMTLSLIERDGNNKQRIFAGRGTSYQQWRASILESMKAAMDLGFEKLREREKENLVDIAEKFMKTNPDTPTAQPIT